MVLFYIMHNKFRSTLTNIAKLCKNIAFVKYIRIIFFWDAVFAGKKPRRARRRASKVGWSYPITFRSLVVRSTALTQIFHNLLTFFELVWDHLGCVWGVVRGPQEQLSPKHIPRFSFVKKVSGRVQEGPRSPLDSLNRYEFIRKILYVLTSF